MKLLRQIAGVDLLTWRHSRLPRGSLASDRGSGVRAVQKSPQVEAALLLVVQPVCTRSPEHHSLRVRVELRSEDVNLPSIHSLYKTADWWEHTSTTCSDFEFEGHPKSSAPPA